MPAASTAPTAIVVSVSTNTAVAADMSGTTAVRHRRYYRHYGYRPYRYGWRHRYYHRNYCYYHRPHRGVRVYIR